MMTFSYLAVATTLWKQQGNMIGDQHSQRNATRDVNMLTGRKKVLRNHIFGLFTFLGEQNRREIQISFHFAMRTKMAGITNLLQFQEISKKLADLKND